jgi:hypothetical protein
VVKIPKECPFPTIVENAMKRYREEHSFDPIDVILPTDKPRDVPKLTKRAKDEIMKLKMYNFMLRRINESLSNKIIEYEKVIQCLKEDNSILRSLVRKLKNELKRYKNE